MPEQETTAPVDLLEDAYRAPLWISLVFVVTMVAIYFMGRGVAEFYNTAYLPSAVESVE